jgi:hypothetical protein
VGALGLGGVALGWMLNQKSARSAAQEEREYTEVQKVRDREDAAAAQLDETLTDLKIPPFQGPWGEIGAQLRLVHSEFNQAMRRTALLRDPEVLRRILALDMGLFVATDHCANMAARPQAIVGEPEGTFNPWPLQVAARELREALVEFQRRETPKSAKFPTSKEVVELSWKDGEDHGLDLVRELLIERGAT